MGEQEIRISDDLKTVRNQVAHILEEFPKTRDNDGLLLCHWLQMFRGISSWGGLLSMAAANAMNFETVRRARQLLQSQGQYLPLDPTVRKRRRLEEQWRAAMKEG